ncbi:MAG TPA: ABC transporter ATP-binding protein [Bacillales bacterium]|nr:ABC transporter ATP-binding protein [Bacillales bacterium]
MGKPILELHGLTKRLGHTNVVDDLSFSIEKGEIFGLLGPNGAGKTTTIRMIVGLISKTDGRVMVNGIDTQENFVEAMEEIGAIVENPEMYKFLTGYQNLIHFARMARKEISGERIDEVVRLVELEQAIHKKVKTYSLGMRQRLGVAQAILHRPALLILDEPTNGLDPQGIYEFREYLRQLTQEGTSVMVSSHLLSEMQLMCDRVAIIQKGKLIDISSVHELTDDAAEQTVVRFEVEDAAKAKEVLSAGYSKSIHVNRDNVELEISRNTIPDVNKVLVDAGIPVYSISSQKRTLEDKFLEMTKAGEA